VIPIRPNREQLRRHVERASITPEVAKAIREIVQLHHEALVEAVCGGSMLPEAVTAQIRAAGIPRWAGPSVVESGVDLGILTAGLKDPFQDEVDPDELARRILHQRELPLSYAEAVAEQEAKEKAAIYCRGLGNTVDKETQSLIVETTVENRAQLVDAIRDETAEAIHWRETRFAMKSRLGRATGEWHRDLHRIAETELHNAMQAGRGAAIERDHGEGAQVAKRPNPSACPACLSMYLDGDGNPRIFRLSEIKSASNARDPQTGKPRKRADWVPALEALHPHCFLPGAVVQGRIQLATRALYHGEAVEILTARGHKLTVTPNHPVPTADGRWLPAGKVAQGDDLLCYLGGQEGDGAARVAPRPDPRHEQQNPARIEEVFDAFAKGGRCARLHASPMDFHGDAIGLEGDVDVVWPASVLLRDGLSPVTECGSDLVFPEADVAAVAGGLSLSCAAGSQLGRLGLSSAAGPGATELALDSSPIHAQVLPLDVLLLGLASELDTCVEEFGLQGVPCDAGFAGKLLDRFPGAVAADKVVQVRKFNFSGHVYDLQSETGWIVADGVVTSNCRCQLIYVPEGWGFDEDGRLVPPRRR
jgi:hypothetical protein